MTFSLAYRFFTEELNIPVSSKYQQAFTIEQLDKQFPGFAKVATETGVTETYFLGAVQDQSWLKTNQASLYDITPSVSEELSKSKDADYPALYVFAMVIAEEASPSRTQLAKMVRFFNRASKGAPVVALFIHRDIFHIAGVERTHYVKTGLVGEKVGKVSLLRDVAQDLSKRHRGHIDILNELAEKAKSVKSFRELYNAWTEVFNISTLNKKFYAELSNWYFWALKHVEFPKGFENGQKWENDASDIDKKECNAQALIRFITRIIFIWFLKEKGLVNKNLFDRDKIKNILNEGLLADEQSAYYRAVLQNLFFCVLNTERNADSPKPLRFFSSLSQS